MTKKILSRVGTESAHVEARIAKSCNLYTGRKDYMMALTAAQKRVLQALKDGRPSYMLNHNTLQALQRKQLVTLVPAYDSVAYKLTETGRQQAQA